MIEIYKEQLLKNSIDYEEYSENICNLSVEELKKEGLLKCGGCCLKGEHENKNCGGCKNKKCCKK